MNERESVSSEESVVSVGDSIMVSVVGFVMSSVVRFHYGVCGGVSILNEIPYGKGWVRCLPLCY